MKSMIIIHCTRTTWKPMNNFSSMSTSIIIWWSHNIENLSKWIRKTSARCATEFQISATALRNTLINYFNSLSRTKRALHSFRSYQFGEWNNHTLTQLPPPPFRFSLSLAIQRFWMIQPNRMPFVILSDVSLNWKWIEIIQQTIRLVYLVWDVQPPKSFIHAIAAVIVIVGVLGVWRWWCRQSRAFIVITWKTQIKWDIHQHTKREEENAKSECML